MCCETFRHCLWSLSCSNLFANRGYEVLGGATTGHPRWGSEVCLLFAAGFSSLAAQASKGALGFCFLNPAQLRNADQSLQQDSGNAFGYIDRVLSSESSSQVVVSHEMLGNRPALVCSIAERALTHHDFDYVVISGYPRLQSSYHISAFSQWFFRDRKRLHEDLQVLSHYDLIGSNLRR